MGVSSKSILLLAQLMKKFEVFLLRKQYLCWSCDDGALMETRSSFCNEVHGIAAAQLILGGYELIVLFLLSVGCGLNISSKLLFCSNFLCL